MRKVIFLILFLMFTSVCYANTPKFKLHIVHLDDTKSVNYSINYPIAIDYDLDSDIDIIYMTKEGDLYVFENLLISQEV